MYKQIPVIKTKIIAPKYKEHCIRRAKLTRKMKEIANYPLTLVHSGAGYGKSTALALYVNDEKLPCCWYSISSSDDDIIPFLTYIIYSIRTIIPNFSAELTQFMTHMNPYIREEELNKLCSLFINEILSTEEEIILILDDYHQIEHCDHVNIWMEKLLEHIPGNLHIVVSSRRRPMWHLLTKMKISHRLLEMTKDDLVLTKDEVELLLCDYYEMNLNEEQLTFIFNITEGWVIALGMIAQQIPKSEGFDSYLDSRVNTLDDLFHYLAKEVFEKQPPIIQQFLEQTSIFEEVDEKVCEAVLGISDSYSLLQQIMERNLFIGKIGEHQYRYHALFKEFLEEQLRKNQPQNFVILHERSAQYFEKREQVEIALAHYQKMNDKNAAAVLLQEYGLKMLKSGKLESLYERLKRIPDDLKDEFYKLWYLEGEVLRFRSLYNEAEASYERAIMEADKRGDQLQKSHALEGKAKIYLDTVQPYMAERLLNEAVEIREKNRLSSEEENAVLYRLLTENLINSGKAKKVGKWIKRLKSLKVNLVDGNLEARLFLRTGQLEKAKRALLSTNVNEEKSLPQSHRETDLLLALIEAIKGNGLESKSLAQDAIHHGIKISSPFVEACGWMRMGHAVQVLPEYNISLAEKCYETALEMMDQIHIERGKAEPLMGLSILYTRCGEYERAIELSRRALQETEKADDLWLSSLIITTMGITSIYHQKYDEALDFLEKAEKLSTECTDEFGKMLSYFWQAYCYFTIQQQPLFEKYMFLFLKQVQIEGYEFFFHKRNLFGPRDLQMFAPLLIEAGRKGESQSFIFKLLKEMGIAHIDSHPGYTLHIATLGQFKVWLGEKEVQERDWQRGKAKELLQLFSTRIHGLFSKDEIYQALWPDQDEKSAARDFKVALNALNNALEPNRKARATPFFLIREGAAYGLSIHSGVELDAVLFHEWISLGLSEQGREKAIQWLEKGLTLYKGDYLPERKYDDWCLNERERLLVLYLRAAERLAQLSVGIEDYDKAIYWCERILEKDGTWEEAYRLLMFCYYRKNNRPFAIKWYQKCCEILENELGITPLDPTRHMYEMIAQADQNIYPV